MNDIEETNSAFNRVLREIEEYKNELREVEYKENAHSPIDLTFWFRGVSNSSYKLTPSLYRTEFEAPTSENKIPTDRELIAVQAFFAREHFESMRGKPSYEALESTYAKMQHYGAPTRLIDWTESFGTALFFATNDDNPDTDGRLYITSPERMQLEFESQVTTYGFKQFIETLEEELYKNSKAKKHPERIDEAYFDVVRHLKFTNPRILAQRGHFTFTIAPPEKVPESKSVKYITLTPDDKKLIKGLLERMNIDAYTIYPDIIGLASYVKSAANLNPRKEFDAIRYFNEPTTPQAEAYLLKRANKPELSHVDQKLFRDTHRSILSDAIYNKNFVEKTIEKNIEDEDLRKDVLEELKNLGKTYLGNIIFPFHLRKRAESFVCEILSQHLRGCSEDALEYHHSSGLGSFDRFTTGLDKITTPNGNDGFFKQIITIKDPATLIEKSVSKYFTKTRFHDYHNVCAPSKVPLDNVELQSLFSSLDGVRKVAILVVRLLNLQSDDSKPTIKYHSTQTDRPGMTYRASNKSPDCIIFLTANKMIPRPFSTFGLYLEGSNHITKRLRESSPQAEEEQRFPAKDLITRIHQNKSEFLCEIGKLLATTLTNKFAREPVIDLLNREDVLAEIVGKCEITNGEAAERIDEIEQIIEAVLRHAKTDLKSKA